ncbi:MAG: hypothetical protein ACXVZV_13350 [Terriglobales bacterium]
MRIACLLLLLSLAVLLVTAAGQDSPIQDNSFLVEEAYNQEDGVIQHISFVQRLSNGDLLYTQTDEWPVRTLRHQLSVTAALGHSGAYANSGSGWGDTAINYRYQLRGDGDAHVAAAPRLSVLLPTGDSSLGRGFGGWGLQTNLPISVTHGRRFVTHWNAGLTWVPSAQNAAHEKAAVVNPMVGQSTVFLASPRVNLLCEWVWSSNGMVTGPGTTARSQSLYVNPGVRWAYNFATGLQIVPGVGVPVGSGSSAGQKGMIFYLSFEHGMRAARSQ